MSADTPESNLDLIRRWYEHGSRAEIEPLMAMITEDSVGGYYRIPGLPYGGMRHGTGGFLDLFKSIVATITNYEVALKDLIAGGDKVVAFVHIQGRSNLTDKRFDADETHVFTIRDGKIMSLIIHQDDERMIEAFTPGAVQVTG